MSESSDKTDFYFNINMTWGLGLKVAVSCALLLASITKIVTTVHNREIRLNKISLVPFYATAAQSLMLIIYYLIFAMFDIRNETLYATNCWRHILGCGTSIFFCLIVMSIVIYG